MHTPTGGAAPALASAFAYQERQARRAAERLHDGAAQWLAALHLQLDLTATELPEGKQPVLRACGELLDGLELQLRELSLELWPAGLEFGGLVSALGALVESFSRRTSVPVARRWQFGRRYGSAVETTVYRFVQEALDNVIRHAQASQVEIELRDEGEWLECAVSDDGRGGEPAGAPSGGLAWLTERSRSLGGRLAAGPQQERGWRTQMGLPAGN